MQADLTLRTNFIVGFAIHTLTRVLFVQTLTQHSESKIFNRHFEIFFSFFNLTFHANCLHCMKCQILFSIAWNVTSAVFWEIKKNKEFVVY